MARTIDEHAADARHGRGFDWRKGMSDNVALALIVYTGLQIFLTVAALKKGFPPMLAYLALIILIVGIIPACRWFERRWLHIGEDAAHDMALKRSYRRDQLLLWLLAVGLPLVITGACKALFAAA